MPGSHHCRVPLLGLAGCGSLTQGLERTARTYRTVPARCIRQESQNQERPEHCTTVKKELFPGPDAGVSVDPGGVPDLGAVVGAGAGSVVYS